MSMFVMTRNGKRESVHFDKITGRIKELCVGLDAKVIVTYRALLPPGPCSNTCMPLTSSRQQHVDPVIISQKVIQGVYPGVTTSELDE